MSQSRLWRAGSMLPQALLNSDESSGQPLQPQPLRGVRGVERERCERNRHDVATSIQSSVQALAVADPASE